MHSMFITVSQSVQFTWSVVSDSATPWTAARQASLSISNFQNLPKLMFIELVMPSILHFLCPPLILLPLIFPSTWVFSNESDLASSSQSFGVSASTSVLPMNTQDWSSLAWMVGCPCSPTESQESSPTPQFKSINSSTFSFLYSSTITSIHDPWKNHSLD